jgi:hypothetical protein
MSLTRPLTRPLTSPLTRAITGYAQGGGGGGSTDPYWSSVVSLLHFDGANASTTFTDQTGKTWSAYGGVQIDTAQSKFGGASGLFNGASDYITTPSTAELTFGAGDDSFWSLHSLMQTLVFHRVLDCLPQRHGSVALRFVYWIWRW